MQVGSLFVALGFQVDDKKLKEFNDSVKGATASIAKLAAGAAAGVYAVNRFISESVGNAQKLNKFAVDTGYATEELERFYNVARSLDQTVSLDQVISGFSQLAELAGSAAWGEFSGKALFAGIYDVANASPREVIETLRRNRDGILYGQLGGNKAAFKQILDEMGLGDFMAAIMADEGTYRKYWESALPTSPEQLESLLRISKAMSDFRYNFSVFRREMAVKIEPHWVKMLEMAVPIISDVTHNMLFLAQAANDAFSSFDPTVQTGIIGFLVLLAARAHPAAAALTVLAGALNEVSKYMQGKDSVFDKIDRWTEEWWFGALNMLQSQEGSTFSYMKRDLAERLGVGDMSDEDLKIYRAKNHYQNTKRDNMPPMPIPMSNVGNTTVNNNMQIYSNESDGTVVGEAAAREIEAALDAARPKSGMNSGWGVR